MTQDQKKEIKIGSVVKVIKKIPTENRAPELGELCIVNDIDQGDNSIHLEGYKSFFPANCFDPHK